MGFAWGGAVEGSGLASKKLARALAARHPDLHVGQPLYTMHREVQLIFDCVVDLYIQ